MAVHRSYEIEACTANCEEEGESDCNTWLAMVNMPLYVTLVTYYKIFNIKFIVDC